MSVISHSARATVGQFLESNLQQFCQSWFDVKAEIRIDYCDALFARKNVEPVDLCIPSSGGNLLFENADSTLVDLCRVALCYEHELTNQDSDFWEHAKKQILNSLLQVFMPEKMSNDISINRESDYSDSISASVNVAMQIGDITLNLHCDSECLKGMGLLSQHNNFNSKPLVPVASALHTTTVDLKAMLNSVSLTLSELLDLKVGDVVRTNQPLEQSLSLKAPSGDIRVKSYLVANDGYKAIFLSEK